MLDYSDFDKMLSDKVVDEKELVESKPTIPETTVEVAKEIKVAGRSSANVQNAMIACDTSCNPT